MNHVKQAADIEALFEFTTERKSPFYSGYCPVHRITPRYLTSGLHQYYGQNEIPLGGIAVGTITFITPEYYPHCLWIGKEILFMEGERIKGKATVLRVLNSVLQVKALNSLEVFLRLWGDLPREAVEFGLSYDDGLSPILSIEEVHDFTITNGMYHEELTNNNDSFFERYLQCFETNSKYDPDQIQYKWSPVIMYKILHDAKSVTHFLLLLIQYKRLWQGELLNHIVAMEAKIYTDVNSFLDEQSALQVRKKCEKWLIEYQLRLNEIDMFT